MIVVSPLIGMVVGFVLAILALLIVIIFTAKKYLKKSGGHSSLEGKVNNPTMPLTKMYDGQASEDNLSYTQRGNPDVINGTG